MKKIGFSILFAVMSCSLSPVALAGWYAGLDAGVSLLTPNTDDSAFMLDEDQSFAVGGFAGFDVSTRISAELAYHFLGNASLRNDSGSADIGYSALSASAIVYLLGDRRDMRDRDGLLGYARIGFGAMSHSHSIPIERADNNALRAGIGFEYPMSDKLNMRAELNQFDGDARAVLLSLVYRPGRFTRRLPAPQQPQVPAVSSTGDTSSGAITPGATAPGAAPGGSAQSALVVEQVAPAVVPDCTPAAPGEPVDVNGCAMFSGVARGVEFVQGTATLTSTAETLLDRLALQLLQYPSLVVELQAHTESFDGPQTARSMARNRAIAVARRLAAAGVPVERLRARAFGSSEPRANNQSAGGRRLNNRIELQVVSQ